MSTTTVNELETPAQLLRRIYDEEFGFLPTNASMKPVHVANAVARRLLGISNDHAAMSSRPGKFLKRHRPGRLRTWSSPRSRSIAKRSTPPSRSR